MPASEPDQMVICGECHHPTGPFRTEAGEVLAAQDCLCLRVSERRRAELEARQKEVAGGNLLIHWETVANMVGRRMLCRCCAVEWFPDLSRWTPYWCDACRPLILQVNGVLGRTVLPIGRHSAMNGVRSAPGRPVSAEVGRIVDLLITAAERPRGPSFAHDLEEELSLLGVRGGVDVVESFHWLERTKSPLQRHMSLEVGRNLHIARTRLPAELPPPGEDVPMDVYLSVARCVSDGGLLALHRLAATVAASLRDRQSERTPGVDSG